MDIDKNMVNIKSVSLYDDTCICIKQQAAFDIKEKFHEKVKQYWRWVEKKCCLKKRVFDSVLNTTLYLLKSKCFIL